MSAIVKTDHYIYEPTFCPETDTYKDICPYKRHERNRRIFNCNCKIGSNIHNVPSFNSHIKSECHKSYIQNYALFKKELTEEQEKNKQLTYEKEMLIRKINKLDQDYKVLQEKNNKLITEYGKFCSKSEKLLNKHKSTLEEITVE